MDVFSICMKNVLNLLCLNKTYHWIPKLMHNKQRDIQKNKLFESKGWRIIVVWKRKLKKATNRKNLNNIYL